MPADAAPGTYPSDEPEGNDDPENTYQTLSQAVQARRAEFTLPKHIRIKIGSWNVAALGGPEKDVGDWFLGVRGLTKTADALEVQDSTAPTSPRSSSEAHADRVPQRARKEHTQEVETFSRNGTTSMHAKEEVDIYALALQEVVDVTSVTEAMKPYVDGAVAYRWKSALEDALPPGYQLVCERQLVGLLLLIYASPQMMPEIKDVSTTSVGTGLMGYMANKGAVAARLVIGDTTRLVFVNSHLAAGTDKSSTERRNWDAQQIVQRTRFEPIHDVVDMKSMTGEGIGDEDFGFWTGDLNYRLKDIPGDDVRRLLMLHTRNQYDISRQEKAKIDEETERSAQHIVKGRSSSDSSSFSNRDFPRPLNDDSPAPSSDTTSATLVSERVVSDDPTSLQTTIDSLLPHDELQQQIASRKAFHGGWKEGKITFLPTYKYDVGTVGIFDSSEKRRAPSWCDRVLYRTRRGKQAHEARAREEEQAKRKDEEMKKAGLDNAGQDEEVLYDYDPDTDGATYDEDDHYGEHDPRNSDEAKETVTTKESSEDEICLEHYTAHQHIMSSDHKPLCAVFRLRYDAVVAIDKKRVQAEVAKGLDRVENEARPNVAVVVDPHNDTQIKQNSQTDQRFEGVWFGKLRWMQSKHRNLTIANTGRVPATIRFVESPHAAGEPSRIAPSYLKLSIGDEEITSLGTTSRPVTLEPVATVSVELEIRIRDLRLASDLNDGSRAIDDVLVLRVEGGRDHFIPVRATWLNTSLGHSINRLIRVPEGGIRRLQHQKLGSKEIDRSACAPNSSDSSMESSRTLDPPSTVDLQDDAPVRFSAPRELFRLTEAIDDLTTRCVAGWEMIHVSATTDDEIPEEPPWNRQPTWPFAEDLWTVGGGDQATWDDALSLFCSALDRDESLANVAPSGFSDMQTLYLCANLLIVFLSALPDGILPEVLWPHLSTHLSKPKSHDQPEDQRAAIQELLSTTHSTHAHGVAFVLLTTMLCRILRETSSSVRPPAFAPPMSPLRRMASRVAPAYPSPSQHDVAIKAMAARFAPLIVRVPEGATGKVTEKRRVEVVEVFLRESV